MNLTNKEYNLINLITNRAKINWFEIRAYDNGFDYVYDNEENETLTLIDGLLLLDDCLTELEDYNLTNEEIEMMRSSAVNSALSRKDTIIVASVAAIYGLNDPEEYNAFHRCLRRRQDRGIL